MTHQNTVFLTTFALRKNKYPESPQLQFINVCLAWEKGSIQLLPATAFLVEKRKTYLKLLSVTLTHSREKTNLQVTVPVQEHGTVEAEAVIVGAL